MSISLPKEMFQPWIVTRTPGLKSGGLKSCVHKQQGQSTLYNYSVCNFSFCILLNFAFTVYSKELTNYTITRVHYTTVHHYTRLPKDVHMYITHHNALVSTLQVLKWITDLCFSPV